MDKEELEIIICRAFHTAEKHKNLPWNDASFNDAENKAILNLLWEIQENRELQELIGHRGNLFRIHSQQISDPKHLFEHSGKAMQKVDEDGNVIVLFDTVYADRVVSFSKNYDFTRRNYYKVSANAKARMIWFNTGDTYGLDVNKLYEICGCRMSPVLADEEEVLFPFTRKYLVNEYECTPKEFIDFVRDTKKEQ